MIALTHESPFTLAAFEAPVGSPESTTRIGNHDLRLGEIIAEDIRSGEHSTVRHELV